MSFEGIYEKGEEKKVENVKEKRQKRKGKVICKRYKNKAKKGA
jgi:hypothetical protein